MAMGVEVPTEVDVRLSLSSNARRLLEHRLTRSLGPSEAAALKETLSEALSTFYADTAAARGRMIASPSPPSDLALPVATLATTPPRQLDYIRAGHAGDKD